MALHSGSVGPTTTTTSCYGGTAVPFGEGSGGRSAYLSDDELNGTTIRDQAQVLWSLVEPGDPALYRYRLLHDAARTWRSRSSCGRRSYGMACPTARSGRWAGDGAGRSSRRAQRTLRGKIVWLEVWLSRGVYFQPWRCRRVIEQPSGKVHTWTDRRSVHMNHLARDQACRAPIPAASARAGSARRRYIALPPGALAARRSRPRATTCQRRQQANRESQQEAPVDEIGRTGRQGHERLVEVDRRQGFSADLLDQ